MIYLWSEMEVTKKTFPVLETNQAKYFWQNKGNKEKSTIFCFQFFAFCRYSVNPIQTLWYKSSIGVARPVQVLVAGTRLFSSVGISS